MIIYSIYKATNLINNKIYIGFTENFKRRMRKHRTEPFNINSNNYNCLFYKAIRKYGFENFQFEIIYQSKNKEHCLNEMEQYFIKEYNSYANWEKSNGYNMTLGGDLPPSQKNKKFTEKHKKNLRLNHVDNSGKNNPNYGKFGEMNKTSKKFIITFPDGSEKLVIGLANFCKTNNLNRTSFYKLIMGKIDSFKGYKCRYA